MKKEFPGYSKKGNKEIRRIWDKCIIVFDTNALLNLYRYSDSTRETILQLISKLSDRIWLPHQAALEYNKNRYEVIADQEKAYKEFMERINQIKKDLQSTSKPPFFTSALHKDLDKTFEKVNAEVEDSIKRYNGYLKEDPIYESIEKLFENRIGKSCTPEELKEIYKAGEERYKLKIPPGYEDEKNKEGNRMYGDLVLWKQIIGKSKTDKKPIVLVTDERKTDWWWKIKDGRNMGPRQELVEEMMNEAGMEFHMYSSERFLSYGQSYLDEKVNQRALEEIQAMKMAELELLTRKQRILEREKQPKMSDAEQRDIRQIRLRELKDRIYSIERQQMDLEIEAQDNSEAQEYIHSLSIQKADLQEELKSLRIQFETQLLNEEMARLRNKEYEEMLFRSIRENKK